MMEGHHSRKTMCCPRNCLHRLNTGKYHKHEYYRDMGSLALSKRLLSKTHGSVSRGIGTGTGTGIGIGDAHVRFALIENEARIRQAVRGIKTMFQAGGLMGG
jgi:aspartate/methionine/tyrosine aminotransferase